MMNTKACSKKMMSWLRRGSTCRWHMWRSRPPKQGQSWLFRWEQRWFGPKTKDCSQHHQQYTWNCQNLHQKISSWIIKRTNKIVQIHIEYDPGERKRYSSDSDQDAVCTDQLFHRGEVKTFYNYQFFARMRDFVRRINTLHLLRLFLLFHGCLVCLMDHSRWWKDDHIQDDRRLLSSLG